MDTPERRTSNVKLRLADVLHRGLTASTLYRLLAAIALWKAVEIAVLGHPAMATPFVLAGLYTLARPPVGTAGIATACLASILLGPLFAQPAINHLTWVFWVALTMAIFRGDQQRFVLRCQLSILYGFSAVAKVWPEFLSGAALDGRIWVSEHVPLGVLVAASWATLLTEAVLAVGVWLRRPWWTGCFLLAVLMHGAFLVFTLTEPWRVGRLVIFGGLSIAVWLRTGPRRQRAFATDSSP